MTLKEDLQKMVETHKKIQTLRYESLEQKHGEIDKYIKLQNLCEERIEQLQDEIIQNNRQIEQLEKIIGKIK